MNWINRLNYRTNVTIHRQPTLLLFHNSIWLSNPNYVYYLPTERSLQYISSLEGSIFKFSPYGPSVRRLIALPLLSIFFSQFVNERYFKILRFDCVRSGQSRLSPSHPSSSTHSHALKLAANDIFRVMSCVIYKYPFFFFRRDSVLKPCSLFTSIRAHLLQANDLSIFLLLLKSFWLFA